MSKKELKKIQTIATIIFEFTSSDNKKTVDMKRVLADVTSKRGGMYFEGDTASTSITLARAIVSTLKEVRNNPHGVIRMLQRNDVHVEATMRLGDRKISLQRILNDNTGHYVQALLLDEFRTRYDAYAERNKQCTDEVPA